MSAAGEFFAVSERYNGDFTLQDERRRRFFWFQDTTKRILPYKTSAAGENFTVSGYYKGDFTLQNDFGQFPKSQI